MNSRKCHGCRNRVKCRKNLSFEDTSYAKTEYTPCRNGCIYLYDHSATSPCRDCHFISKGKCHYTTKHSKTDILEKFKRVGLKVTVKGR